ncbi:DUF3558 domain-containing protein [Nocardia bovistercoris]|uniref:DUF3558 domain-containing protein n=1 Tax=Nocardia bovistercoris TaxID=2785916 RepID=A0A931N2T2_9NOCA|nr:DUF3558 domain-containing protein [Nocardia bovistercoris]MBH0775853.1 DUF3558 domain-containing protein [Nocardia bovistercoris]
MTSSSWRPVLLVIGAVLVLAGCDTSSDTVATSTPAKPSVAPDVPSGFDPCTDIPQSVLASEKLLDKTKDDSNASGGIKWRGCLWAKTDGYAVSIRTTNITIEMVKAKHFPETNEYIIGGRQAVTSRQSERQSELACNLDVKMQGGSLEFLLTNSPSNRLTGSRDSCDLVRELAEKVVPSIPANA